MVKIKHLLGWAIVALLLGLSQSATADDLGGRDCDRVKPEFRTTNQILHVTGRWMEECDHPKSDSIFHHALMLQRRALHAIVEGHCRVGLGLTLEARKTAYEAVILCFGVEGFCFRTKQFVERTSGAIDYLDEFIRNCENKEAKKLFITGYEIQKKAVQHLINGDCRVALELSIKARILVIAAARLCQCDEMLSTQYPDFGDLGDEEISQNEYMDSPAVAETNSLRQNSPNPFNSRTLISYNLPSDSRVTLTVYNTMGQKVKTLVDEYQTAGERQVIWDGGNESNDKVASGVYFYRLTAEGLTASKRMVYLR